MDSNISSATESENDSDRSEYDVRENSEHRYLNLNPESNIPITPCHVFEEPEAGLELTIPVFLVPTVILPGQKIPLTGEATLNHMLEQTVNKKFPYIGVLTTNTLTEILNMQGGTIETSNVGVIVQVSRIDFF